MVDQVFVEQDPEPDIADPAHTTNSHVLPRSSDHTTINQHTVDNKDTDAYPQPILPGLSTAQQQQHKHTLDNTGRKDVHERDLPLGVAHLRSSDNDASVPFGTDNRFYPSNNKDNNDNKAHPVLPAPALPLDSPFAASTAESSETEKDGATTNHVVPAAITDRIRRSDYAYPSHLAPALEHGHPNHVHAHAGGDEKGQQGGGAQGSAQITPAPHALASAGRGISFEQGAYGRDPHFFDGHDDDHGRGPSPKIGFKACVKNTIKGCPILVALPVFIPVAWALELSHQGDVAIFVTCLLAIIPLAGGISFATEELALRLGEVYGGLLNATFGNLVELLIAIIALVKGEIDIVQASMIGSILSNLLLVLGCSYFAGGLRFHEQMYGVPAAQMQIGLLGITLLAIALPSAYHWAYPNSVSIASIPSGSPPGENEMGDLLKMSRGISFILLAIYAMFLTFQLYTHAYLFRMPRTKMVHPLPGPVPKSSAVFPKPNWVASLADSSSSSTSSSRNGDSQAQGRFRRFRRWSVRSRDANGDEADRDVDTAERDQHLSPVASVEQPQMHNRHHQGTGQHITIIEPFDAPHSGSILAVRRSPNLMPMDPPAPGATTPTEAHARAAAGRGAPLTSAAMRELEAVSAAEEGFAGGATGAKLVKDNSGHPEPVISIWFALGLLTIVTALAGVTAEFLVSSIDGLTTTSGVSREFVGLILLPVIGNSVEHITAVTVSVKDKLNLSMSIAIGSSIQVSLCILPILVLIAWPLGQPLTLYFDPFETITLVVAVLLVNFAISDGRTNYLEGFVMMMAYVCIALVCWFYNPVR